ncbi:hypothetical protein [Tahibacter amnicola]|uniref:Malectin domain-containing protein n=1 Tax=Tahibacter amnicola TaxID=2976241 RepID=A0ABY6BJE2_9GAMM|nr:hypothetical protein [Tahibacter amnicola]UXI69215.1 hypothetical protein N4264_06090 [Tahibacter amnicola]
MKPLATALFCAGLLIGATTASALNVTQPDGVNDLVAAGDDFATQVLGDAWDMSHVGDLSTYDSGGLQSQLFNSGIYSAVTTNADPGTYIHHPGTDGTVNLSRGKRHPIATGVYRYATLKIRMTANSGPPLSGLQPLQYFFLENDGSFLAGTIGFSNFFHISPNAWTILSVDMATQVHPASTYTWTGFPTVGGLRLDPTVNTNVKVEIDWIRMTSAPTSGQRYTVMWSDTVSGSYTVTAIDGDNARHILGTGVSGTSYSADLSVLAPGDYRIEVSRNGATSLSPGTVHINAPPAITITAPTARGEQTRNYAQVELGNPWGPMDAADVLLTGSLTNISYTNPTGTFYGRPTSGDPGIVLQTTGHPVNADYYKSACFTLDVLGPSPSAPNSLVRLFWGNSTANMSISKDIFLSAGMTEYCIEDMSVIPVEPGAPMPWAGSFVYFRLDPHEYPVSNECISSPSPANCHDVRIESIVLSPWALAGPSYNITWNASDADNASTSLTIFLDTDRVYANGGEIAIATPAGTLGAGQHMFTTNGSIPNGRYYVGFVITDGANPVVQYSTGPVLLQFTDLIFRNGFQ